MQICPSRPVSLFYKEDRLKSLLIDAETNAKSDWDRTFAADMADRFRSYGMGMHISTLQKHHLERIASDF